MALQVGLAVLVAWVSGLRELLGYIGFTLGVPAYGLMRKTSGREV